MDTPTYNAEGQAIWKPQPGTTWRGGLKYAHSYGGIVHALKDLQAAQSGDVKSYPHNFAGIIAAIEDLMEYLTEGSLPDVGAPPPGWEIIVDGDGNIDGDWQIRPQDGSLWFDTRQGRLFIAIDGQYYQTNGADGISHVGPEPPVNPPVVGQHWLDTDTGLFYVYIGEGVWQAVVSDGDVTVTTATLPLAVSRTRLDPGDPGYEPQIIPELPSISEMQVQKDWNEYIGVALKNLDQAITEGSVTIGDTPPTENVVAGTLWYDSQTLELSIYYIDDDSAQWVPVSTGFAAIDAIAPLEQALQDEIETRSNAIDSLYETISEMDRADDGRVDDLQAALSALQDLVDGIQIPDVSPFAKTTQLVDILNRLSLVENKEVDLTGYATTTELGETQSALLSLITNQERLTLDDITPLIPDVSAKVEQSDIDAAIAGITTEYLPRTGGTLTGSFVVQKEDYALPAFDFSTAAWHSKDAFKFVASAPGDNYTTFGTTDNPWEYAWQFDSDEDFCWIYNDSSKVFSITKDGPACSTLVLGDFGDNDNNGRVIHNKIDVKERLNTYQAAFEQMRQGVSDATDFDSLKANILSALASV